MPPNNTTAKHSSPNENLEIPKWLDEEYFHEILQAELPDYVNIVNYTHIAATAPGSNFSSTMVRAYIEVENKDGTTAQVSYILKTSLEGQSKGAALINSMNPFPKEKLMYQQLLPAFERIYKTAGVDIRFGPKCVHAEESPERITLVMEDLARKNFTNLDRQKGFDMSHMTRVLHKLAELHAASARYCELYGPYDAMFHSSFFNESNRGMFAVAQTFPMSQVVREWGLEHADYYTAKTCTSFDVFEAGIRMNVFDANEFNVLNHGDAWANNIMFNYKENGEIDETLFVDFQMCKWGSPAQDLWYMIISSAAFDIKTKEFDHFVSIYHKRLVECLKLLQYDKRIPTLRELHIQMLKHGFWGVMSARSILCLLLYPPDEETNIGNLVSQDKHREDLRYKRLINPLYAEAMRQLYPFFDNKGILDIKEKTE